MSIHALGWAFKQELQTGVKMTLLVLANFADEQGYCYPSQERIASMVGQSDRNIRRNLDQLETDGFIRRDSDRRDSRGRKANDGFWLLMAPTTSCVGSDNLSSGESIQRTPCPMDNADENTSGHPVQRTPCPQPADKYDITYKDEPSIEPYTHSQCASDPVVMASPPQAMGGVSVHPAQQPMLGGTLLPEMSQIPFEWLMLAHDKGFDRARANLEFEKFCAHYQSTAGPQAYSPNWKARWLKWVLGYVSGAFGGRNGQRSERNQGAVGSGRVERVAAEQASARYDIWAAAASAVELDGDGRS